MTFPWYSHDISMTFPWYSHDIPVIFPWYSHDIPVIFPWYSHDISMTFPWYSHDIPMIFPWYSHDIPMIFPWYSHDIPMIFPWYSHDISMIFPVPTSLVRRRSHSESCAATRRSSCVSGNTFGNVRWKGFPQMQQNPRQDSPTESWSCRPIPKVKQLHRVFRLGPRSLWPVLLRKVCSLKAQSTRQKKMAWKSFLLPIPNLPIALPAILKERTPWPAVSELVGKRKHTQFTAVSAEAHKESLVWQQS